MDLGAAAKIANDLITEHCPPGWSYTWGHARSQFGQCRYDPMTIHLSRPLTQLNTEATFRWVVLHEIAHVLAGSDAAHGPLFRAEARKLGIVGARCWTSKRAAVDPVTIKGQVVYTCPQCGASGTQHKASYALFRTSCCKRCYKRGKVVHFVVTRNGQPVPCPPRPKPRRRARR